MLGYWAILQKRGNNMKQETKIYLTAEQLKNFGDSLSVIMNRLEMTNNNIEVLEVIQNSYEIKFDWLARKFLSTTYEQNRQINKLLNDVSFALLECDNEKELEGLKSGFIKKLIYPFGHSCLLWLFLF